MKVKETKKNSKNQDGQRLDRTQVSQFTSIYPLPNALQLLSSECIGKQ